MQCNARKKELYNCNTRVVAEQNRENLSEVGKDTTICSLGNLTQQKVQSALTSWLTRSEKNQNKTQR